LVEPPTLAFVGLALGLFIGLAGFVILFGPHVSSENYLARNIGAAYISLV
jgi:uncharacterized protein YqgC (DUF456 family)